MDVLGRNVALADLARRQHGLLTWSQLLGHGVGGDTVGLWLASGRLERVAPEVYRIGGVPESWLQSVMAATLDSGGWASHRTAAALHGLDGHQGTIIEIVVERWRRSGRRPPYVVHETKDLRGSDMTTVRGIPCTSLVRTLVDLPAVAHFFRAGQALDDALRKDDAVLIQVRRRFVEVARRGRNGTTAMRALLNERDGEYIPPGSSFEARTLRLIREAGLDEPTKQLKVSDDDFVAFLDFGWLELQYWLECDSLAHHSGKRAHEWDRARRRRLKAIGWDGVEVTYDDVTKRPSAVGRELSGLLDARRSLLASISRAEAD